MIIIVVTGKVTKRVSALLLHVKGSFERFLFDQGIQKGSLFTVLVDQLKEGNKSRIVLYGESPGKVTFDKVCICSLEKGICAYLDRPKGLNLNSSGR